MADTTPGLDIRNDEGSGLVYADGYRTTDGSALGGITA